MPSSVGSRVLPTSCQLLTLGSRRRPILYRPGSTRGGRKGPVHLSGAILIGRNATVHKDCGKEAVDFFEAFCIAPLARHCYLTTELCIMQTSGADADTLQALPLARHPCREQPHYKPKGPRTNRGPFFALALLRFSFPVGFELSLLQRQDGGVQFLNFFGDGRPLLQKHPAALVEVTQRNHHMQVLLLCRLLLSLRRLKQFIDLLCHSHSPVCDLVHRFGLLCSNPCIEHPMTQQTSFPFMLRRVPSQDRQHGEGGASVGESPSPA